MSNVVYENFSLLKGFLRVVTHPCAQKGTSGSAARASFIFSSPQPPNQILADGPESGEQNCRKLKLWKSDIALLKSPFS